MGAVRAIAQSGLHPANCRLLDPGEAALSGASSGSAGASWCSASSPRCTRWTAGSAELTALARDHGGASYAGGRAAADAAADAWRSSFLRMPYVRDGLARMSAIVETFETAYHVGPGGGPVRDGAGGGRRRGARR